jgi:hypothetical protein
MKLITSVSLVLSLLTACTAASDDQIEVSTDALDQVSGRVAEKDLAIIFAKNNADALNATTKLGGEELLAQDWYAATQRGFDEPTQPGLNSSGLPIVSSGAGSLAAENTRGEWRNVSTRVEPCAPLGIAPFQKASVVCWPELRLVMQPIKARVNGIASYADDRGIHLIYDIPGTAILTAAEFNEAQALRATIAAAVTAGTWLPGTSGPLTAEQEARFVVLRNKVARAVIGDSIGLRDATTPVATYKTVGLRPELATATKRKAFMVRYAAFVERYARRGALKQLAAMSLSTRRQTVPNWSGTFISLRPGPNGLRRENLGVASPTTGKELLTLLRTTANVNISSDNGGAQLFEGQLVEAAGGLPQGLNASESGQVSELENVTLIGTRATKFRAPFPKSPRFAELKGRIADRAQVLVPNSSCGSCHALNHDVAFGPGAKIEDASNFHNLSYFDVSFGDQSDTDSPRASFERGLSPSPRVIKDVAFDIAWVASELAGR